MENWTTSLLRERAGEYFDKCDEREKPVPTKEGTVFVPWPIPYSLEGLCCYLGITRHIWDKWLTGEDEAMQDVCRLLAENIIANRVTGALDGSQHAGFAQFYLKNVDPEHYRDRVEVENSIGKETASMFDEWAKLWKKM